MYRYVLPIDIFYLYATGRSLLVKDLINDLERIAGQWEQFGAYLGVPLAELKKIHNNVTGRDTLTDYCFANVINVWLESDEKNVTKEFLVKAIDNIGNHKLAVEVQHKSKYFVLEHTLFPGSLSTFNINCPCNSFNYCLKWTDLHELFNFGKLCSQDLKYSHTL